MVAAMDPLILAGSKGYQAAQQQQELEDEMDNETEAYVKIGTITKHVRDPHRLNVGLTQAMHSLVVVCQQSLLVGNPNATKKRGKAYNAIGNMCANARHRNCYVPDSETGDTQTASVELRAQWKVKDIEMKARTMGLGGLQVAGRRQRRRSG
ncbi:hypothetical protein IMSHALPRED_005785 [Imshaugia aleurites]|uniref:Uncharacterized protein n=1 Tax=Imshaugia aleurites TaxID=172621 RepID=A0A8H3FFU4_9LECA|nr:hypothetical protein IMSHALPRED_005785 [Imshaugia aleurites]